MPRDNTRGLAQLQHRTVLRACEFPRQQEKFVPQFRESQMLPRFLQAKSLEGGDQVVGQANDFHEERIGVERTRGDSAQCVILQQFGNPRFESGSRVVEMPDAERGERGVGNPLEENLFPLPGGPRAGEAVDPGRVLRQLRVSP